MIRTIEDADNVTVNVYHKDGRYWVGKDLPPNPTGEHETVFSFWIDDDRLAVFSMDDIDHVEYIDKK
jgi:hypothetical protein